MAFDKWFGFDTTQRKTLEKMFEELEARILDLEEAETTPDPTP